MTIQIATSGNNATAAQLMALRKDLGAPVLSWRASSLAAAPIAGPVTSGAANLAPLAPIVIPAGTLVPGASQIKIRCKFLRTGTAATMAPTAYVGDVNSFASNPMSDSSLATGGTIGNFDFVIDVTSATTLNSWWQVDKVGGTSGNALLFTTKFNVATDTYVTFGVPAVTAPDSCSLLAYEVLVFQ